MALKSTLEQLESVQAAIEAIEGGAESYMLGDVRVNKGKLDDLYEREKRLQIKYNREQKRNRGRVRLNLSGGQ